MSLTRGIYGSKKKKKNVKGGLLGIWKKDGEKARKEDSGN